MPARARLAELESVAVITSGVPLPTVTVAVSLTRSVPSAWSLTEKADPATAFVETNFREERMVSVDVPLAFTTRRIEACTVPSG